MNKFLSFSFLLIISLFVANKSFAQDTTAKAIADTLAKIDTTSISIENSTKIINEPTSVDTITLVAVGDIMLGSVVPNMSYCPPNNDASHLLEEVSPYFKNADVVFCNVEGTFSDTKLGAKNCNDPKTCFTFGMPRKYAKCFKDAGFNVVSVANNHSGDFGEYGKKNAKHLLDSLEINWAGFTEKPTAEFEVNGIKYGFCAFAPNQGTVQITDHAHACELVKKLKETCDIVIVSFHGGAEGRDHQHVTRQYETFLGQNRGNVYKFAHTVIDAGADIVLGHGPHVTRAVEIYKNKFIAYSMGNFATYSNINITGVNGLAPIFRVKMDSKTGNFISAQIIPTYQIKPPNKGPHIDSQKRVIKVIQDLTKTDIYDNIPNISDEGIITQ